jgi:8-oxo-dGTP diphosphatase
MLPYKIATLVYLRDTRGHLLLMRRKKLPNLGLWSPIGGKLEMPTGESPYEAAVREVREEIGVGLTTDDLHLFAMIAETGYEGSGHWLMFLFDCARTLTELPPPIDEGEFAFLDPATLFEHPIPETDRQSLWPLWFERRHSFTALRADCHPGKPLKVTEEERIG